MSPFQKRYPLPRRRKNKKSAAIQPHGGTSLSGQAGRGGVVGSLRISSAQVAILSRPLPPPEDMERYNAALPGLADRLVSQWEIESEHRRKRDYRSLSYFGRGQLFALAISVLCVCGAVACAWVHEPWPASIIGGASVISLASVFITARSSRGRDPTPPA